MSFLKSLSYFALLQKVNLDEKQTSYDREFGEL